MLFHENIVDIMAAETLVKQSVVLPFTQGKIVPLPPIKSVSATCDISVSR